MDRFVRSASTCTCIGALQYVYCFLLFLIGLHDPCGKAKHVFAQVFKVYHKCLPASEICMQPFLSYLNEIQECDKGGGGKNPAFSETLNVSIRAHGCALWKGCEPEQPMYVYLAALPTQGDWLSFSRLVRPMKKS